MSRSTALTNMKSLAMYAACGIAALAAAGCADEDAHSSSGMSNRQDAAVKDPFSYGPAEGKTNNPTDPTPTKRDDSLKGEWNRAWNP